MIKGVSVLKPALELNKSVAKLKANVVQLLNTLLNSKDSEQNAGGLNILGSLCGLGCEQGGSPSINSHYNLKDLLEHFSFDFIL